MLCSLNLSQIMVNVMLILAEAGRPGIRSTGYIPALKGWGIFSCVLWNPKCSQTSWHVLYPVVWNQTEEIFHFLSYWHKRWLLGLANIPLLETKLVKYFQAGREAQFSRTVTEDILSCSACIVFVFSYLKEGTKPGNILGIHVPLKVA